LLRARDHVPHFTVTALDGSQVVYTRIWQRRHLLLLCLPPGDAASTSYVAEARAALPGLDPEDVALVATGEAFDGMPCPGVLIADRWGEIVFVVEAAEVRLLPAPQELADWLTFVQSRCPECEGEAL
jgi:hypothetical protein